MGAESALIIIPFALVAVLFFEIAARQQQFKPTPAKAEASSRAR
jgi:hypothetical protein